MYKYTMYADVDVILTYHCVVPAEYDGVSAEVHFTGHRVTCPGAGAMRRWLPSSVEDAAVRDVD